MKVFITNNVDGWGAAIDYLQSIRASASVLWFNGASGKVEALTMEWDKLGWTTYRPQRETL
jgi:hypothetical protein